MWPDKIINLDILSKIKSTKEDEKNKQYIIRSKFIKDKKQNRKDIHSYLKNIKLKQKLHKINSSNILRAEQMCLKTNQFNFRTQRCNLSSIKKFDKNKNHFIFLVSLKDKYGDHGIIALVNLFKFNKEYIFIDNFLMSCRILEDI